MTTQHDESATADSIAHPPNSVGFDATIQGQIKTFTGKYVTPLDMKPEMFDIRDIAHSLSRQCRYNGHCAGYLSVAEHSIYVSQRLPKEFALEGLMHDLAEAYIGDMVRPIKNHPTFGFFKVVEAQIEQVGLPVYGCEYPLPVEVMQADHEQLRYELENTRDRYGIEMSMHDAERRFLQTYELLRRV